MKAPVLAPTEYGFMAFEKVKVVCTGYSENFAVG